MPPDVLRGWMSGFSVTKLRWGNCICVLLDCEGVIPGDMPRYCVGLGEENPPFIHPLLRVGSCTFEREFNWLLCEESIHEDEPALLTRRAH